MASLPPGYRAIEGTARTPAAGARRVGPADLNERLTVSIRLRRRIDAPPLPELEHWAQRPLRCRVNLTRAQFAERYGADPTEMQRVTDYMVARGLNIVETSSARRTVVVGGTVAQMNSTFQVDLGRYESPTQQYRGREGHVHLPRDIAEVVEGVFGLDNRRMARRVSRRLPANMPLGASPLTPAEVAGLYNFPLAADATRQTIGLLEFGGGYRVDSSGAATDINAYFQAQNMPMPALASVSVDGVSNSFGSDGDSDVEVTLDIEVAASVAQGAQIAVFFAPFTEQGWVDVVTQAVYGEGLPGSFDPPSVLSISWGWTELEAFNDGFAWTQAAMNAVTQTFQEAAALGVTVVVASGDDGSNCQIGDGKAHVYYPASDPWVTTCGGTSIFNVLGGSFTERTWNDNGITGGGVSDVFGVPPWQTDVSVPSVNDRHFGRGIPDIAGFANGYMIYINGGTDGLYGGTSETAPLYAGLIALINSLLDETAGYLNPLLYSVGETAVFRDVADGGSNAVAGAPGYVSVPGWDACTGWGSVDGIALANLLQTWAMTLVLPAVL